MTKEMEEVRNNFFTFEWICRDPACVDEGYLHRKRVRAQSLERARSLAQKMSIPQDAKVIEEVEEKLKMLILW